MLERLKNSLKRFTLLARGLTGVLLLLAGTSLVLGCDLFDDPPAQNASKRSRRSGKTKPEPAKTKKVSVKAGRRIIPSGRDPFKSYLEDLAVILKDPDKDDKDGNGELEEVITPLRRYIVSQYSLSLIMTGSAVPKAMMRDPEGKGHTVQEGTLIGKKGWMVETILDNKVMLVETAAKFNSDPQKIELILRDREIEGEIIDM